MKKLQTLLAIAVLVFTLLPITHAATSSQSTQSLPTGEKIFSMYEVEQKPQFKGGEAAMNKWLSENIQYPQEAIENAVSGKVTVSFVVEKDGKINNVKVVRGKDQYLDKEAVRVVKAMPKWIPGENNGVAVRVEYRLPITFNLKQ